MHGRKVYEFALNNVKRAYTYPNGNTLDFDVCENRLNEPAKVCLYDDKNKCKTQKYSFVNKEINKYCKVPDDVPPLIKNELINRNEMFIASFNNVDNF